MTDAIPQADDQFLEVSLEEEETTSPSTRTTSSKKEDQFLEVSLEEEEAGSPSTKRTSSTSEDDDNGVPEATGTRRRRAPSPEITGKLESPPGKLNGTKALRRAGSVEWSRTPSRRQPFVRSGSIDGSTRSFGSGRRQATVKNSGGSTLSPQRARRAGVSPKRTGSGTTLMSQRALSPVRRTGSSPTTGTTRASSEQAPPISRQGTSERRQATVLPLLKKEPLPRPEAIADPKPLPSETKGGVPRPQAVTESVRSTSCPIAKEILEQEEQEERKSAPQLSSFFNNKNSKKQDTNNKNSKREKMKSPLRTESGNHYGTTFRTTFRPSGMDGSFSDKSLDSDHTNHKMDEIRMSLSGMAMTRLMSNRSSSMSNSGWMNDEHMESIDESDNDWACAFVQDRIDTFAKNVDFIHNQVFHFFGMPNNHQLEYEY